MPATATRKSMTKRNDKAVKIDAEVIRLATIVAAYKDMHLNEYLSERLLPLVRADLQAEQDRHGNEGKPSKR